MSSAPLGSATYPTNLVDLVKSASTQEGNHPKSVGFSLGKAGMVELALAPVLGLYLGYAVGRLPEVFDMFAVQRLPMILMLVFLLILGLTVPSEAWQRVWHRSRPMQLVALLFGLAFATAPAGLWPTGSFEFVRTRYVLAIALFLCSLVFLRDRRAFRSAMVVYVLCVTAVALSVAGNFDPGAVPLDGNGNPVGILGTAARVYVGVSLDPNDFGSILAATLPIALWLSVGSVRRRIFYGACSLILISAVVPTQSRGGMLAMAGAATALIGVGARGWRRVLTVVLIAGGVGIFLYLASSTQMDRFTNFSANDYNLQSSGGRLFFWKQGLVWMLKRPWGYGIDQFPTYMDMINGEGRAAHSAWVQYGMELGVAGLTTFVALCVFMFRSMFRHRRQAIQLQGVVPEARSEEALASHMIAMLTALLISATFLSLAYGLLLYMAIGLVAAVHLGSPFPESATVIDTPVSSPPGPRPARRVARQWKRQA